MITVGLVQADIKPHNVDANLKHYEELLLDKIQEPVNLLVFPEMYHCGFSEDLVQHAEPMNGRSVAFLHQTAQYFRCDVVATLPIRMGDNIVNRLVWMSPERILGWYDKKHLFLGIEQKICTAGEQRTVIESLGQRWLPQICYDVRFPKWSRNTFIDNKFDYDCMVYTCNFPAPREQALLKLATARAIENQAYALVVNRIGYNGEGLRHVGGTAVISPEGEILCQADFNQEQVLTFTLDFDWLRQYRESFPVAAQWD